jgi:D-3-phosphoglycerate dehydrogenase
MKVIAYDPYIKSSDVAELQTALEELLQKSDSVSLHIPLTEETRGIIQKKTIALMKKGAILINVARGECVVEADVAEALNTGQLGGFATDVWYSDPPGFSPLIGAPNTVLTPHIGASSTENLLRIGDIIVQKIQEFVNSKK